VATVRTEHSHQQTAWQCFLDNGPLAFLPLQDNTCSIVWSTLPEQADELMQLPQEQFEARLTEAFENRLGQVQLCSERGVFPLQLQYVDQYVKPGIALIGDAAHSIHPLAGQGVNLGLLDAACLADVVLDGIARHKVPGSYAQLRRYERWRKGDNLGMMFAMDVFKRLFTTRSLPLQFVRNSGLRITDAIDPLKAVIMQSAAGMRGELPSMIRDAKRYQANQ
jgi:2-octaprenylphenol hydroxylase